MGKKELEFRKILEKYGVQNCYAAICWGSKYPFEFESESHGNGCILVDVYDTKLFTEINLLFTSSDDESAICVFTFTQGSPEPNYMIGGKYA